MLFINVLWNLYYSHCITVYIFCISINILNPDNLTTYKYTINRQLYIVFSLTKSYPNVITWIRPLLGSDGTVWIACYIAPVSTDNTLTLYFN